MRKHVLILLALAWVFSALPACAQPEEGDNELQVFGSLDVGSGNGDDGVVGLTWGRFYSPRQEAGLRATTNVSGDLDLSGTVGPFWRYNFVTKGKAVPYVGLSVVSGFGNSRSGDILAELEVGSRWFMSRQTAFSIAGQTSYDVDANDLRDGFTVLFGFTYLWHK